MISDADRALTALFEFRLAIETIGRKYYNVNMASLLLRFLPLLDGRFLCHLKLSPTLDAVSGLPLAQDI
jgi:hypothetical protein